MNELVSSRPVHVAIDGRVPMLRAEPKCLQARVHGAPKNRKYRCKALRWGHFCNAIAQSGRVNEHGRFLSAWHERPCLFFFGARARMRNECGKLDRFFVILSITLASDGSIVCQIEVDDPVVYDPTDMMIRNVQHKRQCLFLLHTRVCKINVATRSDFCHSLDHICVRRQNIVCQIEVDDPMIYEPTDMMIHNVQHEVRL